MILNSCKIRFEIILKNPPKKKTDHFQDSGKTTDLHEPLHLYKNSWIIPARGF